MSVYVTARTLLARPGRTIVHELLTGDVDLSVLPTGPRTGPLELHCTTEAEALAIVAALNAGTPVDVVDAAGYALRCVMTEGGRAEATPSSGGMTFTVTVSAVLEVPA